MQSKKMLTAFVACAAFSLVGVASGQTYTWTGDVDQDWFERGNWDTTAMDYPDSASAAVMIGEPNVSGNDPIIDLADGSITNNVLEIGQLTVEEDGLLTVTASGSHSNTFVVTSSGSLDGDVSVNADGSDAGEIHVVNGADGPNVFESQMIINGNLTLEADIESALLQIGDLPTGSDIGGTVVLSYDGTHSVNGVISLSHEHSVMQVTESMTFGFDNAPGLVIGSDSAATLEIADSAEFVNRIAFLGGMTIKSASSGGKFVNTRVDDNGTDPADVLSGIVEATSGLTITFAAGLEIEDQPYEVGGFFRPLWAAIDSGAELIFMEEVGDVFGVESDQLSGDFLTDDGGKFVLDNVSLVTTGDFFGAASDVDRLCGACSPCDVCLIYNWVSPANFDFLCSSCGP